MTDDDIIRKSEDSLRAKLVAVYHAAKEQATTFPNLTTKELHAALERFEEGWAEG